MYCRPVAFMVAFLSVVISSPLHPGVLIFEDMFLFMCTKGRPS
eukprot:COSAG02_NODE_469_length_21727_cov_64.506334_15_plen_43_part_00